MSLKSSPLWDVLCQAEKRNLFRMVGEERAFNDAYMQRVKALREGIGMTQEQMATALGIPLDRYKKYEVRSPLPPYLLERFALIVRRDPYYILTGKMTQQLLRQAKEPVMVAKRGRR